jgi:ATP-dependent Lon protease
MNTRFKDVFRSKVVNKKLTVNTGVDEFPRFVVEYLIDNYCTEEHFHDDLQQVVKRLRRTRPRGRGGRFRTRFETRNHKHRQPQSPPQETEDRYWGTIGAINEAS